MTCLTNVGYADGECIRATAARNIAIARLAAMTLIAVDNANQAVDNFRKQWRIAKRGLAIAKEEQGHLENTYWPRELSFLNEFGMTGGVHDDVETIESVEVLGRRYSGRLVAAIADRFAKRIDEVKVHFSRYATSANRKAIQDLMIARSQTIASARTLGRNIAWAEIMSREETDWNRRQAAVVMGKGLVQQAQSLMQSAGAGYGELGQRALDGLNGAMRGMGSSIGTIMSSQNTIKGNYLNPFPTESEVGSKGTISSSQAVNSVGLGATASAMSSTSEANAGIDQSGAGSKDRWNGSILNGQATSQSTVADMQMAPGVVGTTDLVRTGKHEFIVKGITGGTVTVDMDVFPVAYADGQKSSKMLQTKPPEM